MKNQIFRLLILLSFVWGLHADHSRPRINIWVHGTTIRAAIPVKSAKIHNSNKFMHISELLANRGACPRAEALKQGDAISFPLDSFYLFRWNGLLNHKERAAASQDLYTALIAKIEKIKQETNQSPFITIITHSHGGNIALNLAKLNAQLGGKLKVDRLILLACPVHDETAHWASHETFEKVYAFYSNNDYIQIMAMQGFFKMAQRTFMNYSSKVLNIQTKWQHYGLRHNDFKGLSFLKKLPWALNEIEKQQASNVSLHQRNSCVLTL